MRALRGLADWLDERLGTRQIGRALFARKIPAGTGWIYTLGSVAAFLFLSQVATGSFLATSYAPTPDHAYDSVRYVTEEAPFGALVRGLHVWGASAMVVALALHMLRTYLTGAYKYPRELTWMSGVGLFVAVLGLGFTGYLLPWNEKAYWATEVGIRIAEQAPLLGPSIARILRGGDELGAATLTRFYALHVVLLPGLVLLLLGLHLFLVVRQGISTSPKRGDTAPLMSDPPAERALAHASYEEQKLHGEPFYPYTLAKDVAVVLLVALVLAALAWTRPPEVGELADPTGVSYSPRPEWYFLFLFQVLKYFPGRLEPLVAVVLPALAVAVLLALPFLDRARLRHPLDRPVATALALGALLSVAFLTAAGARSPLLSAYVPEPTAVAAGERAFAALDCNHCHSVRGRGGLVGPDLALGPAERGAEWMLAHFRDPSAVMPEHPMPTSPATDEEAAALLAYVAEVRGGGPYSEKAPKTFRRYCAECHTLDGRDDNKKKGPDLAAVGDARSRSFIHRYVEDPEKLLSTARMPAFLAPEGPLSHEQIEDISRFLASQHGARGGARSTQPQGGSR